MNTVRRQIGEAFEMQSQDSDSFQGTLCLNEDFVGYKGHFPDQPVLPGICMIDAVLLAAQEHLGRNLRIQTVKSAKFYSPARPGDRLTVEGEVEGEDPEWRISGAITSGNGRVGKIRLITTIRNQE